MAKPRLSLMQRLVTLCLLIGTASALSSLRFSATQADNFVDVTYDGDTKVLTVPQHCRSATCGANTDRIAALEQGQMALDAAQRANTKAINDLVAALSKHQNEAATDAELASVKADLERAIRTISLTAGPKGDKGRQGRQRRGRR